MQALLSQVAGRCVAYLIAGATTIVAAAYVSLAAYLALCEWLQPPLAAMGTALGAMLVAVAVVVSGRTLLTRQANSEIAQRAASSRVDAVAVAAEIGYSLGTRGLAAARTFPYRTIGVSFLAGVAVGLSPELRTALRAALSRGDD
jgi:hypothetical protein